MTQATLKKMYQLLLTEPHAPTVCAQLERIAREALAEHAMCETQRLGQEIEQCQCPECQIKPHASDCAVHSEPAYPKGECDCGGIVSVADYTALSDKYVALSDKYVALKAQPKQEPVAIKRMKEWIEYLKRKSDFGQHMKIPSEMSAGTCWELALELEQFINTAPPQRTWVGLNDDEIDYLIHLAYTGDEEFVQTIEAKLKEKNT